MSIIKRNKSTVFGLNEDLVNLGQGLADEIQERKAVTGELESLETSTKSSLVDAINELKGSVGEGGGLDKGQNLADLTDIAAARSNLDVLSTDEVLSAIDNAKLALGTNHVVGNLVERDALTDLDTADTVFVKDIGDGSWALFKPAEITDGVVVDWVTLNSQLNAGSGMTPEGIKAAYESNSDTNAFTDDDKVKLGLISVVEEVFLNPEILNKTMATELGEESTEEELVSAKVVYDYVNSLSLSGGPSPVIENVVVEGDSITLTHAPVGGVGGILNFSTVRYLDDDNVSWDAPVVATGTPNVFTVSVDVPGEWDGKTVTVQYLHV